MNSPPIARFPEHLYIDTNKSFNYSLEVFDSDGDVFQCSLISPISFLTISDNCQLTSKSSNSKADYIVVIEIEIIEYLNNKKDHPRSRLPYHIIGFTDSNNQTETCDKSPLIKLLNIENDQIHVSLNEIVVIDLVSSSECGIGMDECLINSPFHWKIKSHIETTIHNDQSEIGIEFEWIPKTIEQCGFQIHCIRCLDQLTNFNDRCIQISVHGPTSQNLNQTTQKCSWSPLL